MKKPSFKSIALILAPLVSVLFVIFVPLDPARPEVAYTAAIALLMAIWWITEAVPLAITALLPIVLFPMFGVMNGKAVSSLYFNHVIFLFIGGFLVALAMQRWNLHRRIALRILMFFGVGPGTVLLGFMLTTAFLSMWISNTATAMMMVPIVLAIVVNLEEQFGKQAVERYSTGLFLSIAYSASIGGATTLIGTPPNLSFVRIFNITFPQAPDISFADWLFFATPVTSLMFVLAWIVLYLMYVPKDRRITLDTTHFKSAYQALGAPSFEEKAVFTAFISMALLWTFRSDISLGFIDVPGWSRLFKEAKYLNDGTVAISVAIVLFLIPSKKESGKKLLDQSVFALLPWHIILLFGGGFALASGFVESGLSNYLATQLTGLEQFNPLAIVLSIALLVTFLTELSSNTATTEMILPILGAMGVAIKVNPLLLMIPATLSASFAFMLPVATPPNAIIFGTNRVRVIDMARTGIFINIAGAFVVSFATFYWGDVIFGLLGPRP